MKESLLLEVTGVLEGVVEEDAAAFVDALGLAIFQLNAHANENPFDDEGSKQRALAVEFYKSCLTVRIDDQQVPQEKRLALGWGMLFACHALPAEVLADGLVKATDELDDPFLLSSDRRKTAGIAYGIDGTGRPANYGYVLARLNKLEPKHREKLIAHLISFSPAETFRLVLDIEKRKVKNVADLSWFDRRMNEIAWLEKEGIKASDELVAGVKRDAVTLLDHQVWWVRLYVCEYLGRYPNLAAEGALNKMLQDPHPLVSARAKALSSDKN